VRAVRGAFLLLLLLIPPSSLAAPFQVEIEGLRSGSLLRNIEARLSIRTAALEEAERGSLSDRRLRGLHRRAESDIRGALEPFGYYEPVIRGEFDLPARRARYTIESLGPRTLVRDISLVIEGDGADFEPLRAVQRQLQMQPGEPLRHRRYDDDKQRLIQAAFELGFLDARFLAADLWVFPDEQAADIEWKLDTGQRWAFGEVQIESENIDEPVIRRYLRLQTGEPFSPQAIIDTQFALSDLGYFDLVEIEPQRAQQAEGRIPLLVRTTPRKDVLYSAGIGFGTDTGARLSAGAEWRRWNRQGHKLRADLRLSEIQNRLVSEYRIPLGDRIGESLAFSAGALTEKFDTNDTLKYEVGSSIDRILGKWKRRLYLNLEYEESRFGNDRQSSTLLIPGISYNRSETDNEIHPRRGWNLFVDVHGADQTVISSATFVQGLIQARAVLPLWSSARLLLRGELGGNFNDDFAELPASQRFFAGGDQSVRGYSFRSIGPRDPETGVVIGGEYLSTLSAEVEQTIWGNFGAAAFYDAGGVDNRPGPKLLQGAGLGFRYRAPIGYINIDLAYPIDRPDDGIRLHLGVRVGL
jgi:translocation and assembly module TamA